MDRTLVYSFIIIVILLVILLIFIIPLCGNNNVNEKIINDDLNIITNITYSLDENNINTTTIDDTVVVDGYLQLIGTDDPDDPNTTSVLDVEETINDTLNLIDQNNIALSPFQLAKLTDSTTDISSSGTITIDNLYCNTITIENLITTNSDIGTLTIDTLTADKTFNYMAVTPYVSEWMDVHPLYRPVIQHNKNMTMKNPVTILIYFSDKYGQVGQDNITLSVINDISNDACDEDQGKAGINIQIIDKNSFKIFFGSDKCSTICTNSSESTTDSSIDTITNGRMRVVVY
jgi:hypothetical protein